MNFHLPVLADEVMDLARTSRRIVDGTAGGGGHTLRFLDLGASVLAIDRDPAALRHAQSLVGAADVRWIEGAFGDPKVLAAVAGFRPDFVLLDLGVSSHQLDLDARGFTFRPGSPLDMRMEASGPTAADLLNTLAQEPLARIFRDYGDERRAWRLAGAIVRRRARVPFAVSDDLVNAIRSVLGSRSGPSDFARLFQAVRIAVNDEISQLEQALPEFRDGLVEGGRLAVISYHSGEDRVVKQAFREWARSCICPPGQPICTCRGRALGRVDPSRPVKPAAEEIAVNARARSAKLRGFVRHA
ncbi:MAG: 16S rRNA (cytosine(1402)-N(4))-methyltransferase RsmH [Gemmatimonadales bacterium]|nr:16S rRNA (cytosine(1402)-N(4))-methyltransferase RsmH [Gemmatimonadales bacterium]